MIYVSKYPSRKDLLIETKKNFARIAELFKEENKHIEQYLTQQKSIIEIKGLQTDSMKSEEVEDKFLDEDELESLHQK